ncbi:hypothetical protein FS837_006089, partial [Tulasnella sp. UAMH 9824]
DNASTLLDPNIGDSGIVLSQECTSLAGDGAGYCVNHDTDQSCVLELNAVSGGWFAMERSFERLDVWFLVRSHENVFDEVEDAATLKDGQKVNPDPWGQDCLRPTLLAETLAVWTLQSSLRALS